MQYSWFKVFNLSEFEASGLFSSKYNAILETIGQKEVLVMRGNLTSIVYEGTLLPVEFFNHNPYTRDGKAVYLDDDGYVWLGIEIT